MPRHQTILKPDATGLLIIDIQEKINAVMKYRERVIESTIKLVRGFQILQRPIFITEQYRKGLGPTEAAILQALGLPAIVEKMSFSCCGAPSLMEQIRRQSVQQLVLCGIETHVCVLQTALDLMAEGFQVHLAADAVSSRKEMDQLLAIERMRQAGIIITSVEMALFELLGQAGTPEFKQISQVIK
ncbi:MAG: hydrolase [candidate division KSB1 bacterium]|nr:hydrolase [candidate division KSB1 bacterium]MDZ7319438.1 hydrolase [candidate division KSB1 bacterium]MDZ7340628.1 hydrolase [candidate division KSB1 bacterium]